MAPAKRVLQFINRILDVSFPHVCSSVQILMPACCRILRLMLLMLPPMYDAGAVGVQRMFGVTCGGLTTNFRVLFDENGASVSRYPTYILVTFRPPMCCVPWFCLGGYA